MPVTVAIRAHDRQGGLAVTLADLLRVLEPSSGGLTWAIAESPQGLIVSRPDMTAFAEELEQVIDIVIVGVKNGAAIPRLVVRA